MAYCPAPKQPKNHRAGERGTALVEFVLATALLIVPLFFGVIVAGLSLVLANQVTEVCRDVAHIYAYNVVDFSQLNSQTLVTTQLARGLGMTPSGGNGVIYLSTITFVDKTACAMLLAQTGNCPNMNQTVVIKRLVIGNPVVKASSYAPAITPAIITSNGSISSSDYLTDASVRAPSFANLITPAPGQLAYVAEMFLNPPRAGLWALFSSNVVAARSIF